MSKIIDPKYLTMPQQVQKNMSDIKDIDERVVYLEKIGGVQNDVRVVDVKYVQEPSYYNLPLDKFGFDGATIYENTYEFETIYNGITYVTNQVECRKITPNVILQLFTFNDITEPTRTIQSYRTYQINENKWSTLTLIPSTDFMYQYFSSLPQGPQGIQGVKGDIGDTGPQGLTGPQGSQGIQGPIGPQGVQGPQGQMGVQGPQGEQGVAGPRGADGKDFQVIGHYNTQGSLPTASISYVGQAVAVGTATPYQIWVCVKEDGTTNYNWINLGYIQGPQGVAGIQGPQGPQGIQGIQGADGPQGPQGPQGIQGVKGDIGYTGPQGPQGVTGPTGPTGATGPKGDIGPQGPQGPVGPQGPKGMLPDSAPNMVIRTATVAGAVITVMYRKTGAYIDGYIDVWFTSTATSISLPMLYYLESNEHFIEWIDTPTLPCPLDVPLSYPVPSFAYTVGTGNYGTTPAYAIVFAENTRDEEGTYTLSIRRTNATANSSVIIPFGYWVGRDSGA